MRSFPDFLRNFNAYWWKRIIFYLLLVCIFYLVTIHLPFSNIYTEYFILAILLSASIITEKLRIGSGAWLWGLNPDRSFFSHTFAGLLLVLLSFSGIVLIGLAIGGEFRESNYGISTSVFIETSLLILVLAANEELLFRGILFQALLQKFKYPVVVVLCSLAFSLAHIFNPGFDLLSLINIFLAGVLFSMMYIHTKSLWLPISFHFFWNWGQEVFLDSAVSGYYFGVSLFVLDLSRISSEWKWLFGFDFGIEQGFIVTIALMTCILLLVKMTKASPVIISRIFKRDYLESKFLYGCFLQKYTNSKAVD